MNTFKSKIDTWLLLIIIGVVVVSSISAASALAIGGRDAWWAVLPAALGVGLPLWVVFGTNYTIDGGTLIVRGGPFRWSIDIATITSVTPTRSPLSSPALSLDRLRVEYSNGRAVMISSKDRERFLAVLEAARADLE